MNGIIKWLDARFPLISTWKKHFSEYYLPKNLNIWYVFGALALFVLVNQFVTGLWLTMFYTPNSEQAFASVEYIMRDVNLGWLLRYMHSTGASAFFIVIYLHIFRGLLYGSYQKPRELVWILGMLLYVFLLIEAFCGYLLPWGQMSYWGAQVITSMIGTIPYIGEGLMQWVRGDYTVANATLQRFFAFHVIGISIFILFFVYLHIVALHKVGSNNPEGYEPLESSVGGHVPFYPHYVIKDLVGLLIFLIIFFTVVFFAPELGGYFLEHSNFIPADPLITPDHIAPIWYMAPFYTILRSVPNQHLGVLCMALAVLIPFFLPWLDKSPVRSMRYKGNYSQFFLVLLVLSFILLAYLGTSTVSPIHLLLGRVGMVGYFAYFALMPWYTRYETHKTLPVGCNA